MDNLVTMDDTSQLFSFVDHMIQSPLQQKVGFVCCICCLLKKVGKINAKVEVPMGTEKARAILLEGSYGTLGNICNPAVHEIDGHACISLRDLLDQICDM